MKYFILLVFFTLSYFSQAQSFAGLKLGAGLSSLKYESPEKEALIKPYKKLKPGYTFGFILESELNKALALQADLIYSSKGFKYKQAGIGEGKNVMNYIELSVLGKYNIISEKSRQFSAFIGAYESYWTNGKYYYYDYSNNTKLNSKVDFKSPDFQYNRFDTGIIAGIQYSFIQKKRKHILDLRYEHGMISSSKEKADALLNRILLLSYSFLFKI